MTPRRATSLRLHADKEDVIEDSIARVIAGWSATRPELPVDPIAIVARLARLQAVIAPSLESVFAGYGVRSADFAVLATLVRLAGESVSQKRLAAELGLSPGTVSLRVDRLAGRDLVKRRADPDDGRGALVSLTARGRELFEACAPEHLANAAGLLVGLSPRDRAQLGELLGKLLYTLEESDSQDRLGPELGIVVDGAPIALEQRRAVGLPPIAGLLVRQVEPSGPAAAGGVRPGDLITAANRRAVRTRHDLQAAVDESRRRSRSLSLELTRGAEPMRLRVRPLAPRPADGPSD